MKYLKSFEANNVFYAGNYKVGDYVLVSGRFFKSEIDQPVKIIREFSWKDFVYLYDDNSEGVTPQKQYIKRYLTPDEINEFEMNLNTKKFNI